MRHSCISAMMALRSRGHCASEGTHVVTVNIIRPLMRSLCKILTSFALNYQASVKSSLLEYMLRHHTGWHSSGAAAGSKERAAVLFS